MKRKTRGITKTKVNSNKNKNNFQSKATSEIRKLSCSKTELEEEMQRLLQANVELATESKKLLGKLAIADEV